MNVKTFLDYKEDVTVDENKEQQREPLSNKNVFFFLLKPLK